MFQLRKGDKNPPINHRKPNLRGESLKVVLSFTYKQHRFDIVMLIKPISVTHTSVPEVTDGDKITGPSMKDGGLSSFQTQTGF